MNEIDPWKNPASRPRVRDVQKCAQNKITVIAYQITGKKVT